MSRLKALGAKDPLLFSGFAFYQVWAYSFFFEQDIYQLGNSPANLPTLLRICSLLILACILATVGLSASLRKRMLTIKVQIICACILGACIPFAMFASLESITGIACLLVASATSALGTACLGILWIRGFKHMEARSLYLGSVVTVAVAIALFSVVHTTQLISLLTLILLIPLSFVLGNQIVKPGIANRNMLVETVIQKELCRYVWVFSACWGIVGLAFGVMSSATNRSLPASDSFPWIVVFSVILLGAFILVLFGRRFTFGNSADMAISIDKPEKDKELAETNRYSIITLTVVMTLIIINTVLPHVTGKGFNSVLTMDLASIVSFSLIELCTLVLFIVFSRRLDIEPTMIYAFGAGGRSLGAAVGNLIGMALGGESLAASSALVAVPLTVIAQVITAIALLLAFVPLKKLGELQNNNEKWKSPVSERCEKLAKRYKLTQRETEVMVLLAKGRSLERVQKELFIAKGTATAHAHHIYQKLGIHSRQELMDLVDGRLPQERQ